MLSRHAVRFYLAPLDDDAVYFGFFPFPLRCPLPRGGIVACVVFICSSVLIRLVRFALESFGSV